MPTITPCLWFDGKAEEAVDFYVNIFKNSQKKDVSRYTEAGKEHHGMPVGSVMVVSFDLDGKPFTALNGGPVFKFSEAISFQVECKTQEDIDHYWEKLAADGGSHNMCGWLKDKYGVSWQIVTPRMFELMQQAPDGATRTRIMAAMMKMTKMNIAEFEEAAKGE